MKCKRLIMYISLVNYCKLLIIMRGMNNTKIHSPILRKNQQNLKTFRTKRVTFR